jgi:hypothetical protein
MQTMEVECKQELGFTDAQLKRGTFIEMLRKCIAQKVNVVEQLQLQESLKIQRTEFVEKATKSYQARFGGAAQRNVRPVTPVVRRVPVLRQSTRARRATARGLNSTTDATMQSSSASSSSSSAAEE